MRTTELGVYILGGVALAILGEATIVEGRGVFFAILAAGAAYVSQFALALGDVHIEAGQSRPGWSTSLNILGMVVAIVFYASAALIVAGVF